MSDDVAWLRRPEAIRERCGRVLEAGLEGRLAHFAVDPDRLAPTAARVADLTRTRFADLRIPYHSRWGHFRAGGVDRVADFERRIAPLDEAERARARFDLVVTSVLLDAGAGPRWRYREGAAEHARSEGLAVASYHLFVGGAFSSDPAHPLRADAEGLRAFDAAALAAGFQVGPDNPLVGLEGRAALLQRLGETLRARPGIFGGDPPRVGDLFDHLRSRAEGGALAAPAILDAVLDGLGAIWPGRLTLDGVSLGDVWPHPAAGGEGRTAGLVPLHKLSQWLGYSLVEPLEQAGLRIVDLDALTGLAEYRNGGLFVDSGVLAPKHPDVTARPHAPGAEVIVEWRALTVALLDRLAPLVRAELGLDAADFPLVKVLEGGTWHAGRAVAHEKRPDGAPPIRIESDGTVF